MLPIIASVLGVFLIIGVGATCRRCNWLTREADRSLTNVLTRVLLPLYFVNTILDVGVTASGGNMPGGNMPGGNMPDGNATESTASFLSASFSLITPLIPPAFGFVATAAGFGIAFLFARRIGPSIGIATESSQRAFALCVGICNYGYIPYPLAERFYPEAMVELILHNVGVELALWSIGILIISGGRTTDELSETELSAVSPWKRVLFSGPLLAVLIASTLRATGAAQWIPSPITQAISALAGCAIPMGLLISGAIIVDYVGDLFSGPSTRSSLPVIASAITIRQILMPTLMLGATRIFTSGDSAALLGHTHMNQVMMLQAAMPAAIFPVVLVQLYEKDTRTAIEVLVSTSIAAIITIPIWLAVGTWWLS